MDIILTWVWLLIVIPLSQAMVVHSKRLLMMACPKSKIIGVVLHNDQDTVGRWIPMKLEVGSWITLQPGRDGAWAIDAHRNGANTFWGAYKGQILEFCMKYENGSTDHG